MRQLLALLVLFAAPVGAHADTHHVTTTNANFTPGIVVIEVGDTVEWSYDPFNLHTVTEGTGGVLTGNEAFHSDLDNSTQTFSVTFDEAFLAAHPRTDNRYEYYCIPHYHMAMWGQIIVDVPEAEPFCAGDAFDGTLCPCGNETTFGAGEGCRNSTGVGAILAATGSLEYATDDLSLVLSQARPLQPAVFLQGASQLSLPFKDGKLCVGSPTERMEVVTIDAAGVGATTQSIVTNGNVPGPGAVRYYQAWYRDPQVSVCGTGSNFSSGLIVEWD